MEKIKLLLYCTKQMPRLVFTDGKWWLDNSKENTYWKKRQIAPIGYNGKIIAECDFEVEERLNYGLARRSETILKGTCLTMEQLDEYLPKHKEYDDKDVFYAIHIKNLNIFDKPKTLDDYILKTKKEKYIWCYKINENYYYPVEKAPQNMMYVYDCNAKEKYILISINPEWLCKILNGEKTIEVRKKVLKEMITDA